MSKWPVLTKAPIVEGLIDLRCEGPSSVSLAKLVTASEELAGEFPSRQERRRWMAHVLLSTSNTANVSSSVEEPDGLVLRSADGKWVVQFGIDGFTVSRMSPYGSWAELKAKAAELWQRYRASAQPGKVIRVAARFINRIPLPPGAAFQRTFLTTFSLAPQLPQNVAACLIRALVPFDKEQAMAIVTQSLEPNGIDCTFDIDAFAEHRAGLAEEDIWSRLDVLREVKNRLFFESLTPETLEQFK